MAIKNWLGATTNWSTDANWSPATAPTIDDHAIFSDSGNPCVLTANVSASGLTIASNYTSTLSYDGYSGIFSGDVVHDKDVAVDGYLGCGRLLQSGNLNIESGCVVQPTSLYLYSGSITGNGELQFVGNSGVLLKSGTISPSLTSFLHCSYPYGCPEGNYGNVLFYADSADGNVILSGLYTFNDLTYKAEATHTLHVTGQASTYDGVMSTDAIHVGRNFTINPNGGTIDWAQNTVDYLECWASGTGHHNIVLGGANCANIYGYYGDVWYSGGSTLQMIGKNTRFRDQINTSRLTCTSSGQFDSDIYCSGVCFLLCQGLTMDSTLYGTDYIRVYSTPITEYWANAMEGTLTIVPSGSTNKSVRMVSTTNYLNTSDSIVSISSVNCTNLDLYLPREIEELIVDGSTSVDEIAAQSYNTTLSKFENNGSIANANQTFSITDELIINGATSGTATLYFYGGNFEESDILDVAALYHYGNTSWPTGSHYTPTIFTASSVTSFYQTHYFYENVTSIAGATYTQLGTPLLHFNKNLTANLSDWPETLYLFGAENQSINIAGTYTPSLNIAKSAGTVDISADQLYNVDVSGCAITGTLNLISDFNAIDATLSGVDITCSRNFILDNTSTINTSVLFNGSSTQVVDFGGASVMLVEIRKSG